MPQRMQIAELDLRIENLRVAIESLRTGGAKRAEIDRALSELARVKDKRLKVILSQVNIRTEQSRDQAPASSDPRYRDWKRHD